MPIINNVKLLYITFLTTIVLMTTTQAAEAPAHPATVGQSSATPGGTKPIELLFTHAHEALALMTEGFDQKNFRPALIISGRQAFQLFSVRIGKLTSSLRIADILSKTHLDRTALDTDSAHAIFCNMQSLCGFLCFDFSTIKKLPTDALSDCLPNLKRLCSDIALHLSPEAPRTIPPEYATTETEHFATTAELCARMHQEIDAIHSSFTRCSADVSASTNFDDIQAHFRSLEKLILGNLSHCITSSGPGPVHELFEKICNAYRDFFSNYLSRIDDAIRSAIMNILCLQGMCVRLLSQLSTYEFKPEDLTDKLAPKTVGPLGYVKKRESSRANKRIKHTRHHAPQGYKHSAHVKDDDDDDGSSDTDSMSSDLPSQDDSSDTNSAHPSDKDSSDHEIEKEQEEVPTLGTFTQPFTAPAPATLTQKD